MQHLAYANLYFSHSPALCLSYLTYDSLSLSALVTYLSLCYHSDLCVIYQMLLTSLPMYTLCITTLQKLILILLKEVINTFKRLYCRSRLLTKARDRTL